jgi:hypothetical protein
VSQDHEEPIFPESTARVPTEDETQVGPLLGLYLTLFLCLVFLGSSEEPQPTRVQQEGQSGRTVLKSLSPVVPLQINLCCRQCEQADLRLQ